MPSSRDERIKVLVLVKGLGLGGAENLIVHSSTVWDRARFDYHVAYLLPWKDQLVPRLAEEGISITCLQWQGVHSVGAIKRLKDLLLEWEPDVVHSHLPLAGIMARLFARGPRQVYTEHNIVSSYRQPTRTINKLTYQMNDAVIAVSEAVAESLTGYPGPPPTLVRNGVMIDHPGSQETSIVRAELGILAETPLIVHVGNIRPHKGHRNLVQAVARLARTQPEAIVISIGGEKHDGDLERIRQVARDLEVEDRIRFLGRRDDALRFIAAADVVVNPSDVEGLPVFILEALSLAKPVVATSVGGVPSVILDNQTGLLVDANDPEQLADAIARAIDSPDAQLWGEAGAALVAADYGLAHMVAEHESIYLDVLAR